MSSHSAFSWKHPRRGLTGGVTNPLRHRQLINRHGRRARRLAWQRYENAIERNLPAGLPTWLAMQKHIIFGPKPRPPGPSGAVVIPNPKPTPVVDHGGTVRR